MKSAELTGLSGYKHIQLYLAYICLIPCIHSGMHMTVDTKNRVAVMT